MLTRTIEALLFASGKPIALTTLSKLLHISAGEVQEALKQLSEMRNIDASGIHILIHDGKAQYVTHPQEVEIVQSFLKEEVSG